MIEKTIVLDLDGILLCEKPTFERSLATPLDKAVKITHLLKKRGFHLIIFTARGWPEYHMTKRQLDDHNFWYDQLLMGKPPAKYYVDDRGMSSLEELCEKLGVGL